MDRNPNSSSIMARSHGRLETAGVAARALLSFIFAMAVAKENVDGIVAMLLVATLLLFYAQLTFMPFFTVRSIRLHVGLAGVSAWGAGCLALHAFRGSEEVCLAAQHRVHPC
jgi:hypothetical protein